ncbi:MAG: hypothetical protein OYL97_12770 [Candidatus Poribacteria bacterium]|nr:hypothetical protein [Candidatus Poribacteria bacterium]
MPDNQRTRLAGTIVTLYRNHGGLFWRIMMPVAIIAIVLDIVLFFFTISRFEQDMDDSVNRPDGTVTVNINTISGIHPTLTSVVADTKSSGVSWQFYLIPSFHSTDDKGITWRWELNFRSYEYSLLILLLLTFCPLSLAVACISRDAQATDIVQQDPTSLTACEMWRQTGRKAFMVFASLLIFILLIDVVANLYGLVLLLMPSLGRILPFELTSFLITVSNVSYIYFLVTLSLYNPCLILENNSIIGIFRRSHALVSGARLRFFGIYLLTGWIASVITSVLLGIVLLVFSVFIPDLAQVREALPPLKFLSLFIGGDVEIVLPQLLSVPTTVAILVVKGLIATFLVPIWAILTTRLYLERVDVQTDAVTGVV